MAELPDIIPLFPLPNFVLFPGLNVPLHIFEPRYREMVADVAQTHGIIGMMMLKGDWERDYYAYPDIYPVGCAGKIAAAGAAYTVSRQRPLALRRRRTLRPPVVRIRCKNP